MVYVQNCLSAAKYLKMATPILSDMGCVLLPYAVFIGMDNY